MVKWDLNLREIVIDVIDEESSVWVSRALFKGLGA